MRPARTVPMSLPKVLAQRYRIVRRVGTGGMADVYLARDTQLGRQVALKILHPQYARDRAFVERFRREARAAAGLQHPNIVSIYDWGREEDFHFIVMEFVEGHSLRDLIAADGTVEPRQAARIAIKVLEALDYAHRAGLVHRDVKPGNILIGRDGGVRVADFGIARASTGDTMTQTGTIMGTAYYLSPEQAQGLPVDGRSDLYSLGVVLYEMLCGRRPFEGESPVAIAYKHVRDLPPHPSSLRKGIPPALEAVVLRSLAKRPEDRYQTAAEMRRDLESFLAGRQVTAAPPAPSPDERTQVLRPLPGRRPPTRRPGWALALALALLGGGLALGTWSLVALFRSTIAAAEVPRIVGLSPAEAERRLRARGLEPAFQGNGFSETVPAEQVMCQIPSPRHRVAKGSLIRYRVSAGKPLVKVPDLNAALRSPDPTKTLENRLKEALQSESQKANVLVYDSTCRALKVQGPIFRLQLTEEFSDQPAGTILDQNPRGGEFQRKGDPVDVTVSKGPEPAMVPNVIGKSEADATATLADAGFRVNRIRQYSDLQPEGFVFAQDPAPDTEARKGLTVTIYISQGPESFPMPDVVGQTEQQARSTLSSRGLVVEVSYVSAPPSRRGIVLAQDPPAGQTVRRGDPVYLQVGQ